MLSDVLLYCHITYSDAPVSVIAVSPKEGPVTGNTLLTIWGANFTDTTQIQIRFANGSHIATAVGTFIDSSRIVCVTPEFDSMMLVSVEVALNGEQFTSNGVEFFYYGLLSIYVTTR